jgi:hypothetical protein
VPCDGSRCRTGEYLYGCGDPDSSLLSGTYDSRASRAHSPGVCLPCSTLLLPPHANFSTSGRVVGVATSCYWRCDAGYDDTSGDDPCTLPITTTPTSVPTASPTSGPTTAPTRPPADDCDYSGSTGADVLLLLDSSSSVEPGIDLQELGRYGCPTLPCAALPTPRYSAVVNELQSFAASLGGTGDKPRGVGTRVALAQYSSEYLLEWTLSTHAGNRTSLVGPAFEQLVWRGGATNTAHAIEQAVLTLTNQAAGARSGAAKVLILVTDGSAGASGEKTEADKALAAVQAKAAAAGVVTFVVGYGSEMEGRVDAVVGTLYSHCTHTVLPLYSYCTPTVLIHCTPTVLIHCTPTILIHCSPTLLIRRGRASRVRRS